MTTIQYGNPPHLPIKLEPTTYYRQLESASYALGKLQIAHGKLTNSDHLIKPLLTREASLSSKIEGTITDSKDVYVLDATGKAPKQDTPVVANYREALKLGIQLNRDGKVTNNTIRQLHEVLLRNTDHKGELGRYRTIDAWIGDNESTPIDEAIYVTAHPAQVNSRMDNLLDYINDYDESPLVKVAVFHYMFEAIHPFEDGNGRIGRMLMPSLLNHVGLLTQPVLYTSQYFEKNKSLYRDKLREVDNTKDLSTWVIFFLESIVRQSDISVDLVDKMLALNEVLHEKYAHNQSPNMRRLVDYIFENPVFVIGEIVKQLGVTRHTVQSLVDILIKDDVVSRFSAVRGRKGAVVYLYTDLLELITV
ncbi:MAG TPA: Fic family protein [Candidatus Saccharimonadales bacterium]|nr:Fic family protein [Candidatus Saccharimonadales bacterium]